MALSVKDLPRVFLNGKTELDDPDPNLNPDEVLNFYSNSYPGLTTATVNGPEIKEGKAVYTFATTVGTKG